MVIEGVGRESCWRQVPEDELDVVGGITKGTIEAEGEFEIEGSLQSFSAKDVNLLEANFGISIVFVEFLDLIVQQDWRSS